MIENLKITEKISDGNCERASNSYLMSLVAIVAGVPFPILNLLATFIFFLANRKANYFVRWHCTQALLSQLSVFVINTTGFWWSVSIFLGMKEISNAYIAYLLVAFSFNIFELIVTFYTAIKVRQGVHTAWWFYGDITDLIVTKKYEY